MNLFDNPWWALAKAAKQRDWAAIDAVLQDRKICGSPSVRDQVIRGFADARREMGEEPRLEPLSEPNEVTIHDLPNLDGIEITHKHDTLRWRRKDAA